MLLELKLDTRNWVNLLPVIQTNLNQSPMISLSWHALIELFTGLPAPSLLDTIVIPDDKTPRVLPVNLDRLDVHLQKLRNYLAEIKQEVVDRKERKRLYQLGQAEGIVCNFAIGNSVLWSRVDKRMRGNKLLVRWGPFSCHGGSSIFIYDNASFNKRYI